MFELNDRKRLFVGLFFEGFLYGIFAMYLQYWQASKEEDDKKRNVVFYSTCVLYVLSVGLFVSDIMLSIHQFSRPADSVTLRIAFIEMASFGCCDFIAQLILIYCCWIVWGCNIRVAVVPSILAFAFLVIWLVGSSSAHVSPGDLFVTVTPKWGYTMNLSSLVLSLTINVLMTGLIVFRIFKVFRGVSAALNDEILGVTGGSKLRRTILVLIESSAALFFIQLARIVVTVVETGTALNTYVIITPIHLMA